MLDASESDVVVVGSGAAALVAALRAAALGASVTVLEKTAKLGGTSAMSGGMTWVPANRLMREAGLEDSEDEALTYIRATAPEGWAAREDTLWQAQVTHGPAMLDFVLDNSPVRYVIAPVPDPHMEKPGAKERGRLLAPGAVSGRELGALFGKVRRSTIPQDLTYNESVESDMMRHPVRAHLRYAGTIAARRLTRSRGKGSGLVIGLLRGCLAAGVRLETEARVVDLLVDDELGGVTGVTVEQGGARRTVRARRGVVLATGGFEWDAELLKTHFPGDAEFLSSPSTNTGDGLKMATRIGAATANMDQANIMIQPPVYYEDVLHGLPLRIHAEPDAILVDAGGRRFTSEYEFNIADWTVTSTARGADLKRPAWLISHWPMVRRAWLINWYKHNKPGWLIKARTLDELAQRTGLPADALKETVARFNRFAANGVDEDFHRGTVSDYEARLAADKGLMAPIERSPFVAFQFRPSILGTKGGIRTNAGGQALRPDGSAIPGLYCAGNVMANPTGMRTPSQVGTTLGAYMTWGFICANSIMSANR
ncbi:FAD-dependent oxidoreductase [Acuticoccus sediminis]|uniref:FAD-dependent oxidoreductase n=1 Tax=Acuticoccus sediminis TaxID=2184697 RepID=UPI001CFF2822|nr:FAD-dependent oxidoreductase [Acuticoccus sediminis]